MIFSLRTLVLLGNFLVIQNIAMLQAKIFNTHIYLKCLFKQFRCSLKLSVEAALEEVCKTVLVLVGKYYHVYTIDP